MAQVALRLGNRLVALIAGAFAVYLSWKYAQRQRFLKQIRVDRITPEELKRKLEVGEDVVIVDLRHSAEFEADESSLPGAVHVPPDALDAYLGSLPRDREVILLCT